MIRSKKRKNSDVNIFASKEFCDYVIFNLMALFFYLWFLIIPSWQDFYLSWIDSPFCAENWNCINSSGQINDVSRANGENYKYSFTFFYNGSEHHFISFSTHSQISKGETVNVEVYKGNVELARIVGMNIVESRSLGIIFFCFFILLYFISIVGGYFRMRESVLYGR
jgi:hypothetical protein